MSINLAFSLLFCFAQLAVGLLFVFRILVHGLRRSPKRFLLLILAAWFAMSGVTELFVSGMEVLRSVTGHPTARGFTVWRGRADTTLAIYSCVLLVVLIALPLRWRFAAHDESA